MDFDSFGIPVIITIVLVAGSLLSSGAMLAGLYFVTAKTRAERRRLVATGIPARAVIVQMRDTGVLIGDQPRLSIVLDVQPVAGYRATAAPFRTTLTMIVPLMALARVTPGATVPVKLDPANPSRLTIDWSAMGFIV